MYKLYILIAMTTFILAQTGIADADVLLSISLCSACIALEHKVNNVQPYWKNVKINVQRKVR